MRTSFSAILLALSLCPICAAQNTAPAQPNSAATPSQQNPTAQPATRSSTEQTPGPRRIASGSVIPVQLAKTIDAKKLKSGDPVEATVTQDMKSQNGEMILPKDTKVTGHITEAQPHSKEQKESQVGIAFDHAIVRNGADMQMPMSIQAIIAPPSMNANTAENAGPANAPSGGMSPGGKTPGMAGSSPQNPNSSAGGNMPAENAPSNNNPSNNNQRPPITGNTRGVIGFSNLQLSPATNPAEGSIVTSEKGNVKLESGTLMLLRVN
jgi:hypothetical protein